MMMNAGLESGKGGAGMAKNQRNEKWYLQTKSQRVDRAGK